MEVAAHRTSTRAHKARNPLRPARLMRPSVSGSQRPFHASDEDLQAVRGQGAELLTDIDRTQRALDEADRVLDGTASEVAAIAS
jgi:hypothetical protein